MGNRAELFEKNFFDLTKERQIRDHLEHLKRTQILVAGCETDVCVLQSCLGLLSLDYEVYIVEDLLFSSSPDVGSAVARMQSAGAVLVSYKTLYYDVATDCRKRCKSNLGLCPRIFPTPWQDEHLPAKQTQSR